MRPDFVYALAGGVMIGLASALLLLANGRIAGISGILGSALTPRTEERGWRLAFLVGLLAGGALIFLLPQRFDMKGMPTLPFVAVAGLCVGVGTRLGSGCTSGHGVCGVGRGSPRSLVATMTFMLTGGLTVFVLRHLV